MRRLCAIIAVTAGCSSHAAPDQDRSRPSAAAREAATRDDAGPVDALQARDATELPVFDFMGSGVPIGYGGVSIGDPLPAITARRGTFGGAASDMWVHSDDGSTVSQIAIWIDGDLEAALATRFGPANHHMWKGTASWLIDAPNPFDFSGMPNTVVVIVRPDEHHVCGRNDGFAQFYTALQHAVAARDWAAVAKSMAFPQIDWSDVEGGGERVELAGPADLVKEPSAVFSFELLRGTVTCDLGARRYTVVFGSARLSPAIYVERDDGGVWKLVGVGHAPHDLY